jgi:drug/metabolite transporter (DMT)-like permease
MILCFFVPLYLQFFDSPNSNPSFNDWMWLLILALVCTVIAFILSLNALKSISAFTANLSYNLEPVYSILLAFILFDEHKFLGRGFYMGIMLILFAVVLQMMREWKKRKEKSKKAELVQVNNLAV